MKTLIYSFFALTLAFIILQGCQKYNVPGSANNQLVAGKYIVKINEPDSLFLVGAKATDSVKWTVVPSGFDSLLTRKDSALIFFKKAGHYSVKATASGKPSSAVSITVTDSVYKPIAHYTTLPLTGDQITLVPYYYKSTTSDSSYLSFIAKTKNYYCGTGKLNVADSLRNNNYALAFLNVTQPTICVIGQSPVAAVINFTQNKPGPVPNGTFPLSVTLNGTAYTGSITVTATTITYNWKYTSGVLISPQQVTR